MPAHFLRPVLCALWATLATMPALATEDYASLYKRLQGGDTTVDFRALRFAYAGTPAYAPNRPTMLEHRRAVQKALSESKFDVAASRVDAWLAEDPLNPFAHLGAARVFDKNGQAEKAKFHDEVAQGIGKSICGPGEGQDEAKPCPVISIDEELFYLSMFGFKFEGQHGQLCSDGTACDVIDVTDPKTRKGYVLYMDISRPLARLQGDQGKAEAPPPPPPP